MTYMGPKLTYMGPILTFIGLKLSYMSVKLTYMGPRVPDMDLNFGLIPGQSGSILGQSWANSTQPGSPLVNMQHGNISCT